MKEQSIIIIDKLILGVKVLNPQLFRLVLDEGECTIDSEFYLSSKYDPLSTYYKSRIDIEWRGRQVAYIKIDKRTLENKRLVYVQLSNYLFYVKNNYWFDVTCAIMKSLSLSFSNIYYLEIAYDSPDKMRKYKQWYENSTMCNRSGYKPFGRRTVINYSCTQHEAGCIYVNGKTSNVRNEDDRGRRAIKEMKIYDKIDDATKKNKSYVLALYRLNGFDLEQGVDRVELSLQGYQLKNIITHVEQLKDEKVLFAIFKKFSQNYLKWYDLENYNWQNGNKRYNIVELIDFNQHPIAPIFLDLPQTIVKKDLKTHKTMAKELHRLYLLDNDEYFIGALEGLLSRSFELKEWYIAKWEYIEIDYSAPCEDGLTERIVKLEEMVERLRTL